MSILNNASDRNQNWTAQKLIDLSRNLSQAYYPGLDTATGDRQNDSWTTEKLIKLSKSLSSAYGIDF